MKITKQVLFAAITLILAQSAFAQQKFAGRVIEVVDGKTVVIEIQTGKITAVLQHIDVPETGQPLHATVKEHLGKLVLGKPVMFHPRGLGWRKTVGRLMLDDVDVSQKMLRDGAAWLEPLATSGQEAKENQDYRANESQAKAEKRGVWSIKDMKPAWEFRAAKAATEVGAEEERKNYKYAKSHPDMWIDVGGEAAIQNKGLVSGLFSGYSAENGFGHLATQGIILNLKDNEVARDVEIRFFYFHKGTEFKKQTAYVIGVYSKSTKHVFAESSAMRISSEKQEIVLAKAERFWRERNSTVEELLQYKVNRSELQAIADLKSVNVKIGEFSGAIDRQSFSHLRTLLNATLAASGQIGRGGFPTSPTVTETTGAEDDVSSRAKKQSAIKNVGPLTNNYNEARKTGSIGTPLLQVTEVDKESQQVTVIDFTYAYNDADRQARKGRYVLRLFSFANGWRFLKSNALTILADEQTIVVGKPRRLAKKENDYAGESLQYELKRGVLDKIVNARDVVIKIGDYGILPSEGLQMILYSLLQASDEAIASDRASGSSNLRRSAKISKPSTH